MITSSIGINTWTIYAVKLQEGLAFYLKLEMYSIKIPWPLCITHSYTHIIYIATKFGVVAQLKTSSDYMYYKKKAVRIICHVNPRSHSDPLFKELGLLNVWQINDFLIAQFMYKAYHGHLPSLFDSFFVRNCDVHHHETRQSAFYFNMIKVRTNYRKRTFVTRALLYGIV